MPSPGITQTHGPIRWVEDQLIAGLLNLPLRVPLSWKDFSIPLIPSWIFSRLLMGIVSSPDGGVQHVHHLVLARWLENT